MAYVTEHMMFDLVIHPLAIPAQETIISTKVGSRVQLMHQPLGMNNTILIWQRLIGTHHHTGHLKNSSHNNTNGHLQGHKAQQ